MFSRSTLKRGPDSNRGPSGYEPDELATALPRDVAYKNFHLLSEPNPRHHE